MKVIRTEIDGLLILEPKVFGDSRGFVLETFQESKYRQAGVTASFVQDNHSHSESRVLRGLHFQKNHPQGKLVFVSHGEVYDAVVDLRRGSPSFGRWFGVHLSDENHRQLWVPPGFAHGFCVLSDTADFHYKCTDYYSPGDEGGILWNDPDLNIAWPVEEPILNERDAGLPRLKELAPEDLPRAVYGA